MIPPKDLHRKLATLLAESEGREKEDYLLSVLANLENSFIKERAHHQRPPLCGGPGAVSTDERCRWRETGPLCGQARIGQR